MKKINIILILLILITIIFIIVKICNQEVIEKVEFEAGVSKENLEYEVEREILYGEKSNYSEFNNEGQRVNTSNELKKVQTIESELEVIDFNISYQDGYTRFIAKVKNSSSEIKGGYDVELICFNAQNEEVSRLKSYLNSVEPNEETMISTTITSDMADVYRCEIQKLEGEN